VESRPPKVIEAIAALLIPPACREEILGDLAERCRGALQYSIEAVQTIPCVVFSRIRRTTDGVVLLMNGAALYTTFTVAAWVVDRPLLAAQSSYARLAIPPLIVLLTVIYADAYADPKKRWPLKPLFAPILGIALAFAWRPTLGEWALPGAVMAWGGVAGAVLVSTLRLIFPPVGDRPQTIGIPAHWQKLELVPFTLRPRDAIIPLAILAVVLLYLLRS